MKVSVIGSKCKNGMQLYKMATKAISKYNPSVELIREDSDGSMKKYNVKDIPGLIIDDKLICQGRVLSEKEVGKLIA